LHPFWDAFCSFFLTGHRIKAILSLFRDTTMHYQYTTKSYIVNEKPAKNGYKKHRLPRREAEFAFFATELY